MTAARAREPWGHWSSIGSAFTVRRIPDTDPRRISADDAWTSEATPYTQEALALDFFPSVDDEFAHRPTHSSDLPEPEPFVARIAQAVVEVISGQRPATQLIRHTSPTVYSLLARRALVSSRRLRGGRVRAHPRARGRAAGKRLVPEPRERWAAALQAPGHGGAAVRGGRRPPDRGGGAGVVEIGGSRSSLRQKKES